MEACATSHHWGREIGKLGHETRLIPPVYVKPFVKRQKNDANDAEAIAEAASRPTMRYVSVKSAEQQARGMAFRTRGLFVRQRSQLVNALRGHLAEYGPIIAQGMVQFRRMMVGFDEVAPDLPAPVQDLCRVYIAQISILDERVCVLDKEIQRRAKTDEGTSRLMTIPPLGHVDMPCRASGVPDMTFRDDDSRVRADHAPKNSAVIKHMAMNLLFTIALRRSRD